MGGVYLSVHGLQLQEGQLTGERVRQIDVDVHNKFVIVGNIDVESIIHTEAETEIEIPRKRYTHAAVGFHTQSRDTDVHIDFSTHAVLTANGEIPLDILITVGVEFNEILHAVGNPRCIRVIQMCRVRGQRLKDIKRPGFSGQKRITQ